MSENINFLQRKFELIRRRKRIDALIKNALLVLLVVYSILLLAVFAYNKSLSTENKVLTAREKNFKTSIESYQKAEAKQVYLKSKVGELKRIIELQGENQEIVEAVFNLIPKGVSLDSFKIEDQGQVSFSVQSGKFSYLVNFIDTLKSKTDFGNLKLTKVVLGNISFNIESGYNLNLLLYFNYNS